MKNLLQNPKLLTPAAAQPHLITCWTTHNPDKEKYETEAYGNITRPGGWFLWCVHATEARHEWDPANTEGWVVPEVKLTELGPDGTPAYPNRWHGDARAIVFFNRDRTSIGGIGQVIDAIPGHVYGAGGWGEGWNAGDDFGGNPHCSWGAECEPFAMLWDEIRNVYDGQVADALESLRFRVGIDPRGGMNPFAESMVWGPAMVIYNDWAEIPVVSAKAETDHITFFVWAENRLRTHMNDRYVTDFWLIDNDGEEPEPNPDPEPEIPVDANYDYPVVESGSKLHPHAVGEAGTYDLLSYLVARGYSLPFCKVVACKPQDLPAIRNLKRLSPLTRIIARVILGDDGFNPQGWSPHLDPETYMAQIVTWAKAYPEADYWELWNEEDPADHVPMARFAISCMDIAEREGFKLVLLDYSSGVPENADWQAIWDQTEFFRRAKAGRHLLGIHAYRRTANAAQTAAHLLRIRWLYENLLIPNDCVVPFVITEYSIDETGPGVGISDWSVSDLMAEYQRSDALMAEMYYCLGASVYTLGQLPDYNHNTIWRNLSEVILAARERKNALPPVATDPANPRDAFGYDRVVIIADPTYMTVEQLMDAYARGCQEGRTVTPSWQDAVPPEVDRSEEWTTNTVDAGPLPAGERDRYTQWVHDRDPGTVLVFDAVDEPEPTLPADGGLEIIDVRDQMAANPDSPWFPWEGRLLSEITHVFVHHSAGAASSYLGTVKAIAAYHTRPTGKNRPGICYAYVIGADGTVWQTADVEDVVFSQGSLDHPGDENRFGMGVCLLGSFVDGREPTPEQIESLTALIAHIEGLVGTPLQVWGHKDVATTQCPGASWPWRAEWGAQGQPEPLLIGFNDYPGSNGTGAEWLIAQGKGGLIVRPIFLSGKSTGLDFSAAAAAGIRVIVNLRRSWSTDCGGSGTLPLPGTEAWQVFVQAAVETMLSSAGVWGWTIGNEANNPREFPVDGRLTPEAVVETYNAIRDCVAGRGIRMAPGALDPFNAQAGDPRDWLIQIYDGIDGAGFVTAHGYVRGADPELVGSTAKFADHPLQWQYLNYPGCITALLDVLPAAYQRLPVYVTEFNHLWTDAGEGHWGWVDDARAAEVVHRAVAGASGFAGLALYRWAGDEWAIERNGAVLGAVGELLG